MMETMTWERAVEVTQAGGVVLMVPVTELEGDVVHMTMPHHEHTRWRWDGRRFVDSTGLKLGFLPSWPEWAEDPVGERVWEPRDAGGPGMPAGACQSCADLERAVKVLTEKLRRLQQDRDEWRRRAAAGADAVGAVQAGLERTRTLLRSARSTSPSIEDESGMAEAEVMEPGEIKAACDAAPGVISCPPSPTTPVPPGMKLCRGGPGHAGGIVDIATLINKGA